MSVQLMTTDQRKSRRFSPQQKLEILREWEKTGNGRAEVARRRVEQ